jgi:lipoprotein-anchoring transpeptidase ErfK/SrfK
MRSAHHHRSFATATLAVVVLLAAACSSGGGSARSGADNAKQTTTTTAVPVTLAMNPATGATDVRLDAPINVSATNGTITEVVATSAADRSPLMGQLAPGGSSWTSIGPLKAGTTYNVKATGTGVDKDPKTENFTFTTLSPASELHTTVNVGAGRTYGVGVPIIVQLNHPISDDKKAAVAQRLTVTAAPGVVGAWRWFTNQELHWRPSAYYPANTPVSLKIDFAGLDAGDGVWGVDGRTIDFKIGNSQISYVDTQAHTMNVSQNGQIIRTLPVSTGRDQYPTKSGIHVVNEKMATITMDSTSVGIPRDSPDGYYEEVKWDVRISNSGEFVHAAPWSTGDQGSSNVSHGCVNLSDADGQWFYEFSQVGDVVQVTGSPEQLAPDNGYGDWQIPFDQWAN